jgi:hypothetical protein
MSETTQTEDGSKSGLDKARLKAEQQRKADENRSEPPNPPFPFRVIGFDPLMAARSG